MPWPAPRIARGPSSRPDCALPPRDSVDSLSVAVSRFGHHRPGARWGPNRANLWPVVGGFGPRPPWLRGLPKNGEPLWGRRLRERYGHRLGVHLINLGGRWPVAHQPAKSPQAVRGPLDFGHHGLAVSVVHHIPVQPQIVRHISDPRSKSHPLHAPPHRNSQALYLGGIHEHSSPRTPCNAARLDVRLRSTLYNGRMPGTG